VTTVDKENHIATGDNSIDKSTMVLRTKVFHNLKPTRTSRKHNKKHRRKQKHERQPDNSNEPHGGWRWRACWSADEVRAAAEAREAKAKEAA
jgi:hypothetical protein